MNHTQKLCAVGLCTAIIAILAQISIPLPFGVPFTLQTFAIILTAIILGARNGAIAATVYVLLGAIGLPIFHNFTAGFQVLLGPTGGFLFSFPLLAYLVGLGRERGSRGLQLLLLSLGVICNHIFGVLFFCIVTGGTLLAALTACVLPFLPTTILQAILAYLLGSKIYKRMGVSNLI